jgi:plastocyanin
MNFKRTVLLTLAVIFPFLIAGCTSPPNLPLTKANLTGNSIVVTTEAPAATVTIINDSFTPENITIHAGQAVRWIWNDNSYTHNVTFNDGVASPDKTTGTWTVLFKRPGIYRYTDTLHFKVFGRVTVLADSKI